MAQVGSVTVIEEKHGMVGHRLVMGCANFTTSGSSTTCVVGPLQSIIAGSVVLTPCANDGKSHGLAVHGVSTNNGTVTIANGTSGAGTITITRSADGTNTSGLLFHYQARGR